MGPRVGRGHMTDDVAHAPAMSPAAGPATVRPPEVAGAFYPADPGACADLVTRCLEGARPAPPGEPKVIVVPHAGHEYSGPIAGTAYAPLAKRSDRITRVVMLGPAHRVGFAGVATTAADAWASPLGVVPVDWPAMRPLLSRPGFRVADAAFEREHCLEVQLPFLQRVLDDFAIVPILVGDASQDEVAEVLEALWGGPETLILISTDLSHFHDYDAARRLDGETARRIELMQPEKIDGERACGNRGLGGALKRARELDLRVTALDVRNSGDTSGTKDRVVGYGAFAMEYAESRPTLGRRPGAAPRRRARLTRFRGGERPADGRDSRRRSAAGAQGDAGVFRHAQDRRRVQGLLRDGNGARAAVARCRCQRLQGRLRRPTFRPDDGGGACRDRSQHLDALHPAPDPLRRRGGPCCARSGRTATV